MTLNIYGYAGCTTVKKAREWAQANGIEVNYSHFDKVADLSAHLDSWIAAVGMDRVFNAKAQTLKKLDDAARETVLKSDASRRSAMIADPRLIKRPVATNGATVLTGFDLPEWERTYLS